MKKLRTEKPRLGTETGWDDFAKIASTEADRLQLRSALDAMRAKHIYFVEKAKAKLEDLECRVKLKLVK